MPQYYYQLGGFRSPLQWFPYDDKRLAQGIAGGHSPLKLNVDDPVELALGIKPSGTSHLLLTVDQTHHVANRLRLQYPRAQPLSSMEFESVSPVYFYNPEELAKKLGTMKPKSQKGRPPWDNSQANKHYASKEDGVARGTFEHGRLLYCILRDALDLRTYALDDKSWAGSLQVCSFVFNTVLVDQRHSFERSTNPRVLDIGIAEATIPDIVPSSPIHIRGMWNTYLSRGKQGSFQYGTTEELDRDAADLRVRQFFADKTSSARPTILLVHDRQVTLNFLKNCGVSTKNWEIGVKGLLGFETYKNVKPEPGPSRPNDPRRQQQTTASSSNYHDFNQRQHRPRSRSRSPLRRSAESPHKSPRRSPGRNLPSPHQPPRSYAPIYVVDVQELYTKLMQTQVGSESVNAISKQFGQPDITEWCAGNEAFRIIDIWRAMVSGPSIDDQRTIRTSLSQLQKDTQALTSQPTPDLADSDDEERDPNDFAPISATAPLGGSGAGTYGDDDSDYGQSDSD